MPIQLQTPSPIIDQVSTSQAYIGFAQLGTLQ